MQVSEVALAVGISADTVRYYTRIGLLEPQKNASNGYKAYAKKEIQRLKFIRNARQLGFSVKDIEAILAAAKDGRSPCHLTKRLIEQRLKETEAQFLKTQALRAKMQTALADWQNKPTKDPSGDMICHLIENFDYKAGDKR
jgi:DNA-binding transcriptional MerR regulator